VPGTDQIIAELLKKGGQPMEKDPPTYETDMDTV
jgi:hypothetical protein